jgi:NAD+ synthase
MGKKSTIQVEKVNEHIVSWLKTYANNAKVSGFVVGISGGVDSAVTSTLCAQTGLPTLCVEMPIHQAPNQVSRGREHIEQLSKRFPNVSRAEANLTPIYESFKAEVPESENEAKYHLSLANTRARLRMTTLYYFAGIHGYLVAGTGNKVEDFGVGFYTKYGDGGVDVSPIADLMKSDVYPKCCSN